ncbi:MAG: hypothetical protein BAA03_05430 [Caldibacillus debilis]|nr:MAG: hypothetical protein BAA03_05430 [Caldibacillus debilis]
MDGFPPDSPDLPFRKAASPRKNRPDLLSAVFPEKNPLFAGEKRSVICGKIMPEKGGPSPGTAKPSILRQWL